MLCTTLLSHLAGRKRSALPWLLNDQEHNGRPEQAPEDKLNQGCACGLQVLVDGVYTQHTQELPGSIKGELRNLAAQTGQDQLKQSAEG